jgi:hypothetical protein
MIKRIHNFGPSVGKWKSYGTVELTIARERKRLREQGEREKDASLERIAKVRKINER